MFCVETNIFPVLFLINLKISKVPRFAQMRIFFWSLFSRIRTEYEDLLHSV